MLLNILLAAASAFPAQGNVSELPDTIRLEEVEVSAVKQGMSVTEMPAAASVIGQIEAEKLNINSLKGISAVVPNFFYARLWLANHIINICEGTGCQDGPAGGGTHCGQCARAEQGRL